MTHYSPRQDAEWHHGRRYVPTSPLTHWVNSWEEFREVGGAIHFSEDQTEVVLTLPESFKFGIRFMKP